MEASEATQQAGEQAGAEQQGGEQQQGAGVGSEGVAALEQRIAALEKPADEGQGAQTGITDPLLDYLSEFEDEGEAGGEQQYGTEEGLDYGDEGQLGAEQDQGVHFDSREEFDAYLQDQAAKVLQPYALSQELDKRRGRLEELDTKYEGGISRNAEQIKGVLQGIAEEYGNEHLMTDPRLVEQVYKSLMADEASAAETPAEEASNAGASLESNAGPGNQGQSENPDEAIKSRLLETAGGTDPFTS